MREDLIRPFLDVFDSYTEFSLADKCMKWMELTFGKILPPIEQEDDGREKVVLNEKASEQVKMLTEGLNEKMKERLPAEIEAEFQELENGVLNSIGIREAVKQIDLNLYGLSTKQEKERYVKCLLLPFRRMAKNRDRFHKIINLPFSDRYCVQNCLHFLYGAMMLFADYLDAKLIQHGIDLLALQDECGIHLIRERNTHCAYKLLGKKLADKYLFALPKRQGVQPQPEARELPEELKTDGAQKWLDVAVKKGLLDSNYQPTPKSETNTQKALLAEILAEKIRLPREKKYVLFERLWGCRRLAQTRYKTKDEMGTVRGGEVIEEAFKEAD